MLHQRSLCSIVPPAWLTASNLAEIVAFEKNETRLWDDADRLPRDYYEIAKRLTGRKGISFTDSCYAAGAAAASAGAGAASAGGASAGGDTITTTGSSTTSQSQVISLLVQDLLEVRVDKLRQQLPALLLQHQESDETDLIVNINGIGSQELALLRPFIQQALNDRAFLLAPRKDKNNKEAPGMNETENDENRTEEAASTAAAATTTTKKRVPLRRFRR